MANFSDYKIVINSTHKGDGKYNHQADFPLDISANFIHKQLLELASILKDKIQDKVQAEADEGLLKTQKAANKRISEITIKEILP